MSRKESLWVKFLYTSGDDSWTKDDLLDVLHWWKQAVALVVGAVCGYCGVLNLPGVLTFLAVAVLTTIIMYKSYLKVEEDDFGGHQELVMDGLPVAFGTFLLMWILVYSATAHLQEPL